jgi:hypothetical protein
LRERDREVEGKGFKGSSETMKVLIGSIKALEKERERERE